MAAPTQQPKSLVMILARELASNLATPLFVVDPAGTLVFFNEPAEELLGKSFSEAGELPAAEWGTMFDPRDGTGAPIPVESLPLSVALTNRRPSHAPMVITRDRKPRATAGTRRACR
jgi:PAS domain-containing protein